jgi:two-component sensor histidine kinase
MHPLLASRRRVLLYLLAWTPILALLVYVTAAYGAASWREAASALAPACAVYAFVCLSPFYVCRSRPLSLARTSGLAGTFGVAALAGGLIFAGTAWMAVRALGQSVTFQGIERSLTPHLAAWFGMGVLLYLLSVGLHYAALAAEAGRDAERRAAEARTLAREAELQSLRMQINPHFLFNCLHSISALATQDGARAREMCVRLAGFLRSSLGLGLRESIPLREELALARSYLEVEQVRFGARLRVTEEIESGCENCSVPALLLQPLVENAVKHGIAGLVDGGTIRLAVRRNTGAVTITVENGFDPEMPAPSKSGMGLKHVRRRLQVRYGDDAEMDAGPVQGPLSPPAAEDEPGEGVYRVVLRMPCESPMASSSRA